MPVTATERLRGAGLRITRQRRTVLDAINPGEHLDVETIVDRARTELGSVSTQAVYDALHTLDSAGLVGRIEPAGGPALFEARREGPATTCRRGSG